MHLGIDWRVCGADAIELGNLAHARLIVTGSKAVSADDYTAIKAAQKANASVRSPSFERAEILSLPDGTTSVPDFQGRAIVIPVSVKSVVCAQKNRRHYIAAVKFSI